MEDDPVSKIKFDLLTGFKFKAAYKTYSEIFDNVEDAEDKRDLNDGISKLHDDEISYSRYYDEIEKHRENSGKKRRYFRARIKGQRKWAYNRSQQEKNRIRRHKQ